MNFSFCNLPLRDRTCRAFSRGAVGGKRLALLLLTGVFAFHSPLHAFWQIARGELILNTTVEGTYDSNVFGQRGSPASFYVSLIPELQFLRQAGRGTIDLRAGVDITRFTDLDGEDFEDYFGSLEITYPVRTGSPLSGGFIASHVQETGIQEFLNARVTSERSAADLNTNYRVSERLGVRNRLNYTNTAFDGFSDVESYSGTLGLQWIYSSHLSWFSDVRLRRAQSSGNPAAGQRRLDNLYSALFLGATGVLRPRINGTVAVGYQQTDARAAGPDRNLVVTSGQLDWDWRPRTDLTLLLRRDLDISPADEAVETSSVRLGLNHEIDPKIHLLGRLGYRHYDFGSPSGRQDDAVSFGAGVRYLFTRYWNAALNYDFTSNSSNLTRADYTRQTVNILTRLSF